MSEAVRGIVFGLSGVFALAIIAVLVSQRSQTVGVVQSAASGLSSIIQAAVSPVTGGAGGNAAQAVAGAFGLANSTGNNLYLGNLAQDSGGY